MPAHYRRELHFGPVHVHLTEHGFSSWTIKLGRWSWNSRTRRHRFDLPGRWTWVQGRRGSRR